MHSAVEQTRYWMWTRRKFSWRHFNSSPSLTPGSSFESWEEKAFAEDSAGHLGGCVWPPRSYSCSFCKREFRSAQALGGHMNVHRRDRARLKQPPSPTSDDHSSHHPLNPHASLGSHNQTQVCSLVYNFNPNPNPTSGVAASNVSPKVSVVSNQEKCSDHILISPTYSSSITKEDRDESLLCTPPAKDFITIQQLGDAELKLGRENWRLSEVGSRSKRNIDEADCKVPSNKRTKMDSMFPFFGGSGFGDQQFLPSEALKLGPSIVEDLDLELRLGDPPKVK